MILNSKIFIVEDEIIVAADINNNWRIQVIM